MYSDEYLKRMTRLVSLGDLKGMHDLIEEDPKTFNDFLIFNEIPLDGWIDHVLEIYNEGGLPAAS